MKEWDLEDLNNKEVELMRILMRIEETLKNCKTYHQNEYKQLCDYYDLGQNEIQRLSDIIYNQVLKLAKETSLTFNEAFESILDYFHNPFVLTLIFDEFYLYQNQN